MTITTEGGRYPKCTICGHRIENGEETIDDGFTQLCHGDCFTDKYGKDAALKRKEWKTPEWKLASRRIKDYLNFDKKPPGKYGERKIA